MNDQYQQLFSKYKHLVNNKRIGLFSNQVSFDFPTGKYLFQLLADLTSQMTVFVPEHGLFAEQQDQVAIDNTDLYGFINDSIRYISFYDNSANKTGDIAQQLSGLDTLIIDIQEVGVRYYTYVTTIGEIITAVVRANLNLTVIVIDRPNPAGRQVEGTILTENFSSLIGLSGLPHRYGLTIGELFQYLTSKSGGHFQLEIIEKVSNELPVNPSPNIPSHNTCMVFSGQCLLEGTNLSEGRGTTRPFEIFGAPFVKNLSSDWVDVWNRENPEAVLRPVLFIPTFHKYKDQLCYGFQLHPGERQYHSLIYSLKMLRSLRSHVAGIEWLEGPYEAGSVRPAIELLAGDDDLVRFLNGGENDRVITDKMKAEESQWIELTRPFVMYPEPLFSIL